MPSPRAPGALPPAGSRARQIIDLLGLAPHPERGFYAETHRARQRVLSRAHSGERAASTAIYFFVCEPERSTYLHRLKSDEVLHLYEGGPLEVLRLHTDGSSDVARLGVDLARGERPQLWIAAGTWFGTELAPSASHCLIGCTVAPGFDFDDFELEHPGLAAEYPAARDRIARLSRY